MKKYGNSFTHGSETMPFSQESVWIKVHDFMPGGAFVPKSATNTEGSVIPAGTPVSIDKVGGTTTLNGTAPDGLTYEDATVGADGCSLTIVTSGQINESLVKATITTAQKTALAGRILFVKEA